MIGRDRVGRGRHGDSERSDSCRNGDSATRDGDAIAEGGIGERTGVRLPHAIYALAAQATGKDELIRDALRTYGNSIEQKMPVNPKYRLFDAMGGELVMGISDRYWTEKTGTRTPDGGLLRFWDEKATDDSGINVDDLI